MNQKKINYTIVDKQGKVVEDLDFSDYDKLADHMLELADKYYQGVYDPDDSLEISAYDETGEVVYTDKATFKETQEMDSGIDGSFDFSISDLPDNRTAGRGFGEKTESSARRSGKKNK
jgi:hypothetical protein